MFYVIIFDYPIIYKSDKATMVRVGSFKNGKWEETNSICKIRESYFQEISQFQYNTFEEVMENVALFMLAC